MGSSRAYLLFRSTEDVLMFKKEFDSIGFPVDGSDGGRSWRQHVIMFAPSQRTPKDSRREMVRSDGKGPAIENEPEYIEFVKRLEQGMEVVSSEKKVKQIYGQQEQEVEGQGKEKNAVQVTALMKYVQQWHFKKSRNDSNRNAKGSRSKGGKKVEGCGDEDSLSKQKSVKNKDRKRGKRGQKSDGKLREKGSLSSDAKKIDYENVESGKAAGVGAVTAARAAAADVRPKKPGEKTKGQSAKPKGKKNGGRDAKNASQNIDKAHDRGVAKILKRRDDSGVSGNASAGQGAGSQSQSVHEGTNSDMPANQTQKRSGRTRRAGRRTKKYVAPNGEDEGSKDKSQSGETSSNSHAGKQKPRPQRKAPNAVVQ